MCWFNKSKRTWEAAFNILKETRTMVFIKNDGSGVEYRQVNVARQSRESRRRDVAHKLAHADGYKQHPDHYWYAARKAMIMADKKAKEEWKWNNR
jgi:hypothetical protein